MFRVAGFPTRTYKTLAPLEQQPSDFSSIPKTYLDLGISTYAVYEWHCCFESEKLGIYKKTVGKTQQEAQEKMSDFEDEISQAKDRFLADRTI